MKQITKIFFIIDITIVILSLLQLPISLVAGDVLLTILGVVTLILSGIVLKNIYPLYLTTNRNSNREKLTDDERQIIKDAKELIKKVDENIEISEFNVYKVNFLMEGWFNYDEDTKELNIFIPFKNFLKFGKDFCFIAVVHEILHSQNLKNNTQLFNVEFLEGLNHLLTLWLVETYSEKYKIPKRICIASLKTKNESGLNIFIKNNIYDKEVKMVEDILQKSKIDDLKDLFLKYIDIDLQSEFFKNFVPVKYFVKQ